MLYSLALCYDNRGYDENGFYVNDPNRRSNSEKQWDFDTLRPQVKRLWVLR